MNQRIVLVAIGLLLASWAIGPTATAAKGATPAGTTPAPLMSVTIPDDMLPPAEGIVGFFQIDLAPGTVVSLRTGLPIGTDVLLLLSGGIEIVFDAPTPILRPDIGGTPVAGEAGEVTTVTLGPGEAIAFPTQAPREIHAGGDPAVMLAITLSSPTPPPTDLPAGFAAQSLGFVEPEAWAALPEGAVTVTLDLIGAGSGGEAADGTLRIESPTGDGTGTYVLTVAPAGSGLGTPVA
jgi:hypothetical protein